MASSLASTLRLSSNPSPTGFLNQRITLLDNTISTPPSEVGASDENLPAQPSSASTASEQKYSGRRETLRKAIAQRKYRRWGTDPFPSVDNSEENLPEPAEESPDQKAAGTVERVGEDEEVIMGGGVDGGGESSGRMRGRERSDTGGNAKSGGKTEIRTGRKKKGKDEKEIAEIDILYENQRGMFICGIPFFSSKGLLNFDPPAWQNRHHAPSLVSILNAQVPDPSWIWSWKTWYVDMTTDVDEEGWTYSFSFNPSFSWHGTHIWFHSFVRRRRWLRKRVKLHTHESGSACGSREGSRERPHGLNPDYFTIHSRARSVVGGTTPGGTAGVAKKPRRSVMEGAGWSWKDEDGDGKEDSEQLEEEGITDVPRLMSVLHNSRLDREKIEAVEGFLRDAGEEVSYLPERVPAIMSLMIFQASRRQLLSLLIAESEKAEIEANSPTPPTPEPSTPPAPLPPTPSEPTTPLSEISATSQNALLPPSPSPFASAPAILITQDLEPTLPTAESHLKARELARRKVETLKKAITVAEEEVRRMEYWSDIAEMTVTGQTTMTPQNGMGVGGAAFAAGEEGPEIKWVEGKVDIKGKGKEKVGKGKGKGKETD